MRFLVKIRQMLEERRNTASYKFALLHALADLSVEKEDDPGAPLTLTTFEVAKRFILYCWNQARPYQGSGGAIILKRNWPRQARMLNILEHTMRTYGTVESHLQ